MIIKPHIIVLTFYYSSYSSIYCIPVPVPVPVEREINERKKFYEHSCCSVLLLLINFTPYPRHICTHKQLITTTIMQQKNDKNRKRNAENTRASTNVEQNCAPRYVCVCVSLTIHEYREQFKTKWMLERNKLMVKYNECSEHTLKVFFLLGRFMHESERVNGRLSVRQSSISLRDNLWLRKGVKCL